MAKVQITRQEAETKLAEYVQMAERLDTMLRVELGEQKQDDARIEVAQAELGRLLVDEAFGLVSAEAVETKRQEVRTLKLRRMERPLFIAEARKREKELFKLRTRAQRRLWELDAEAEEPVQATKAMHDQRSLQERG